MICNKQVGTGSASVSREVAEVQKLLKASGLHHTMHSAGTTVGMLAQLMANVKTRLQLGHSKPVADHQTLTLNRRELG